MKPAAFTYHAAQSIEEAVGLLATHGEEARLLAGGQSLVPMMNMRLAQPRRLIDINAVAGLDSIRVVDDQLEIGALTRHHALAGAALVRARCPILAQAASSIGHYAIRTRGTIGGSLAHADPAAQLPLIVTLLNGEIEARSVRGARTIGAGDFFAGIFTTALASDELLSAVRVPCLRSDEGWGLRLMSRRAGDFAIVAVATTLLLDDRGSVAALRLGLAGVAETPLALIDLAAAQRGSTPDDGWIGALARAAATGCAPLDDPRVPPDYRRELVEVLVARALADARTGARRAA